MNTYIKYLLFVVMLFPCTSFAQKFTQSMIPIRDGEIVYSDTVKLDKPGNKIAIYEKARKSLADFFHVPKAGIELSPRNNGSLSTTQSFDFEGWSQKDKSLDCRATFSIFLTVVSNLCIFEISDYKIQQFIEYSNRTPNWYDLDIRTYYSQIDSTDWANKTMKNLNDKSKAVLDDVRQNVFHQ